MKPIIAGVLAGIAAAAFTGSAIAADPFGIFERPSTGAHVQFYNCSGKVCGKIVKVKDASKQSTVGTVILKGADKVGDNKWKGDLLNTEDGKTYSGHLTLLSPTELKLEGCTMAVLCKGETWRKVN
jgi:uncharacterized protein (DUF2147 family)